MRQQQTITGQRFGIGIGVGDRLFDQTEFVVSIRPTMEVGLGNAAPPDLVGKPERPVRMGLGQAD